MYHLHYPRLQVKKHCFSVLYIYSLIILLIEKIITPDFRIFSVSCPPFYLYLLYLLLEASGLY